MEIDVKEDSGSEFILTLRLKVSKKKNEKVVNDWTKILAQDGRTYIPPCQNPTSPHHTISRVAKISSYATMKLTDS